MEIALSALKREHFLNILSFSDSFMHRSVDFSNFHPINFS